MAKIPSSGGTRRRTTRRKPPADAQADGPAKKAPPARQPRRRPGGVPMQAETPDLGHTGRQQAPPPKVSPSPPFWLTYIPNRWDVIGEEEPQLVPSLYALSARAGANGVGRHPKTDKPLPAAALAQAEENGHIPIPWDVDGPGTSYLRREPQTGGWFTRWEQLFSGSADIRSDADGYAQWLRSLIDRGYLPECPVHVIERLLERYERNLHRYEADGTDTHRAIRVRTEKIVAVLQGELDRAMSEGGHTPAPTADDAADAEIDMADPNSVDD